MGLASALSTALTGLSASEATIDVVGNNLANSNTVGFKASEATFATQFLQTQSLGSGPSDTSGGTNPRQVGLGTMVADITPNFTQGTVEISSNSTDMAIQGDGFFIVEGRASELAYTRNGIFKMNSQNQLTTITSNRLLGYGVNDQFEIQTTQLVPITIPLGSAAVAKATENVSLQGTLIPKGDLADAAKIIQTNVLGDASYTHPEDAKQPTMTASGVPDYTKVTETPTNVVVDILHPDSMATGTYYYRFVYSDGAPGGALNLEGTPSAASTAVVVDNTSVPPTNAVQLSGLNLLSPAAGSYTQLHIYRTDGTTDQNGTYRYIDSVNVGTANYTDRTGTGSANQLNTNVLNTQYSYYIAYGKSGSDPSRPSTKIGPLSATDSRIHITNLQLPATNPNGWDSWIVYRNAPSTAGDNRFFEVTNISFASGTTSFTDNTRDADLFTNETVHTSEIDMDGPKIQAGTLLSNVVQRDGSSYNHVFTQTGLLDFDGKKGGRDLYQTDPRQMTVTPASTVGDLLTFISEALGIQPSDPTTGIPRSVDLQHPTATPISPGGDVIGGRIRFTGNNGVDNAIDITTSGLKWDSGAATTINMPFSTYQEAVGESTGTNFQVYDSLGIACNVHMTAVLESRSTTSTTYRWFADSPDNQPATGEPILAVGTGTITFDGEGKVTSVSHPTVSINRDQIASNSPLQFTVDFSALSGLQSPPSALSFKSQDGSAPGVLTSFIIGEDGLITGVFGESGNRTIGQIRLARFSNPAGLEQKGENLYAAGVNSGMPVQGNPGQQGIGAIVAGAVELSNADVGSNLINLILASTMYRGNTKVISTVQQMLDTLLQLQR